MNDVKELLIYCIHIAEHKGVFYTKPEFDQAREYVENQLDEEEINDVITALKYEKMNFKVDNSTIIDKLSKQKELSD